MTLRLFSEACACAGCIAMFRVREGDVPSLLLELAFLAAASILDYMAKQDERDDVTP